MRKLIILLPLTMAFVSAVLGQTETPANCPTISVTGPAGITQPGDSMEFKAIISLTSTDRLAFQWTISAGTIERGQGTQVIKLRTTREMNNSNVTATVEISGLPKHCVRTASETAGIFTGDPVLIDEFGKLPKNDVRGRLDLFLAEVTANKDQVGTIILHYKNESSQSNLKQRIQLIKDHVFRYRRFPAERIVIFLELSEWENTRLYRLPPDVAQEFCTGCKREPTK